QYIDNNPYLIAEKIYGIEFRHPFFDVRLIEFMLSLPWHYSYNYENNRVNMRVLFRESMRNILPENIRKRRDKAEFSQIIYEEINNIDLENLIKNSSLVKHGMVKSNELKKYMLDYPNDRSAMSKIWRFVNAEMCYSNMQV
ncbi:asparagine synthase-related protein, partial [Sulfurovum riftiae]|uniref:asparagine synthase-related protein n=1 Tax=Sulfurovum riftiae TaxID=1630136 RepID=UPI000A41B1BA